MPRKKDHNVVAQGLARGLSQVEAVRRAGYSDSTARKKAYLIVQRPLVQSKLTEALARQGGTLGKIVKPVVDALDARVRVTVPGRGRKPPKVYELDLPDHDTRLKAHDRAVVMLGGRVKPEEIPDPVPPPVKIVIHARRDPPADHPEPAEALPASGPGGSGAKPPMVQQQAVIVNVHPERERPR